jgi:hypothetical protein
VPGVVEELAVDLAPTGQRQLQGLLLHLKKDSGVLAERQKRAMATNCEQLVPEEYNQLLRAEFERRCLFGERTNTETMNSHKFTKWLQECGIVSGLHGFRSRERPPNTISLGTADVVFHKALRDYEYGGKRLNYELFCKALLLVAQQTFSELDDAGAFNEILSQIINLVSERSDDSEESYCDLSLDPNVVVTLDNFKPALHDLFLTVCGRKLDNPMQAKPGLGTIRSRERTFMKYSGMTGYTTAQTSSSLSALDRHLLNLQRHPASSISSCRTSDSTCEPESCKGMETLRTGSEQSDADHDVMHKLVGLQRPDADDKVSEIGTWQVTDEYGPWPVRSKPSVEADILATKAPGSVVRGCEIDGWIHLDGESGCISSESVRQVNDGKPLLPPLRRREVVDCETQRNEEWEQGMVDQDGPGLAARDSHEEVGETDMPIPTESYVRRLRPCVGVPEESQVTFVNGVPTIRDRCRRMSVEQMLFMCKSLNIMPDLVTRVEVIAIFKLAQHTGFSQGHGSSLHGYLSYEEFMDAVGQLAFKAYSKQPYSEEYPEAHEKVEAFLLRILPSDQRKLRDQFLHRHGIQSSGGR